MYWTAGIGLAHLALVLAYYSIATTGQVATAPPLTEPLIFPPARDRFKTLCERPMCLQIIVLAMRS